MYRNLIHYELGTFYNSISGVVINRGKMQSTLTTLLIITSAVALACVAVNYALTATEQTLQPDNAQTERIQDIQDSLLNQTSNLFDQFNGTAGIPLSPAP